MIKRKSFFKFSNGKEELLTLREAHEYCVKHDCKITHNPTNSPIIFGTKDGFKPGYDPVFGQHVDTRRQHAELCKRHGYEPIGKESPVIKKETPKYFDHDVKKQIYEEYKKDVSDRELDAISD